MLTVGHANVVDGDVEVAVEVEVTQYDVARLRAGRHRDRGAERPIARTQQHHHGGVGDVGAADDDIGIAVVIEIAGLDGERSRQRQEDVVLTVVGEVAGAVAEPDAELGGLLERRVVLADRRHVGVTVVVEVGGDSASRTVLFEVLRFLESSSPSLRISTKLPSDLAKNRIGERVFVEIGRRYQIPVEVEFSGVT